MPKRRAAHFLLIPELSTSPPNEAIISAYLELGCDVDLYAPGGVCNTSIYGPRVRCYPVHYGRRWLLSRVLRPSWRKYSVFSGTAEDPLALVGLLSKLHQRPAISLVDEIMSGGYRGNSHEAWKRLCRYAMRRSAFDIVNDHSRIALLRDYADLAPNQEVIVYPGCFREPPPPSDRTAMRHAWAVPDDAVLIGASGGFNLTAGADWLIEALGRPGRHAVIQPLGLDALSRFLLSELGVKRHLYVEPKQLDWRTAWSQAAAFDIGVVAYLNPAPQFQHMGTSSNRLCMFLAMGVPVIASRQNSFQFLEDYDCGILVDDATGFSAAIDTIRARLPKMRENALRCADEYIAAPRRYAELRDAVAAAVT